MIYQLRLGLIATIFAGIGFPNVPGGQGKKSATIKVQYSPLEEYVYEIKN